MKWKDLEFLIVKLDKLIIFLIIFLLPVLIFIYVIKNAYLFFFMMLLCPLWYILSCFFVWIYDKVKSHKIRR